MNPKSIQKNDVHVVLNDRGYMKKNKKDLMPDTVKSDTIHFGIELELKAKGECGEAEHDDDACYENQFQYWRDTDVLREHIGLTRSEAESVRPYFDEERYINDIMDGWTCDGSECGYWTRGASESRKEIETELRKLTGNNSIKVVEDGSIDTEDDETDIEVCWNFHASKDTIKDNEKILEYCKRNNFKFDTSCGLHINLNNYLKIKQCRVERKELEFLFNLVAPSRRKSSYCGSFGIAHDEKYSMIYNQGDRLEFRFFSPTLEKEKLHHYIVTAHVIYKRLAGIDAKLPKKTAQYLLTKMMTVNKLPETVAIDTLDKLNSIEPIEKLEMARRVANEIPF